MFGVKRIDGKVACCYSENSDGSETQYGIGSREWNEFLEWNAKQARPLDLSDQPPAPKDPEEDDFTPAERKAVRALLKKAKV